MYDITVIHLTSLGRAEHRNCYYRAAVLWEILFPNPLRDDWWCFWERDY